jgi:hypothetical protein
MARACTVHHHSFGRLFFGKGYSLVISVKDKQRQSLHRPVPPEFGVEGLPT